MSRKTHAQPAHAKHLPRMPTHRMVTVSSSRSMLPPAAATAAGT